MRILFLLMLSPLGKSIMPLTHMCFLGVKKNEKYIMKRKGKM